MAEWSGQDWLKHLEKQPALRILSDRPKADATRFGFGPMAATLVGLISEQGNQTPFTIGIHGPWGSGKTTLLETTRAILQDLYDTIPGDHPRLRPARTVRFNAWQYREEEALLAVLVEEISGQMLEQGFYTDVVKTKLVELKDRFNWAQIPVFLDRILTGGILDPDRWIKESVVRQKLPFMAEFRKLFGTMVAGFATGKIEEPADDKTGVLVLFIDDLDRCPPDRIVAVLEAIKIFLDHRGLVTVLAMDMDRALKAVSVRYSQEDADSYVAKIIQVPLTLLPIHSDEMERYIQDELDSEHALGSLVSLVPQALERNLRDVKRVVNRLHVWRRLAREKGLFEEGPGQLSEPILAKWAVLDLAFPRFMAIVKADRPAFLLQAQKEAMRLQRLPAMVEQVQAMQLAQEEGRGVKQWEEISEQFRPYFTAHPRLPAVLAAEPLFTDEQQISGLIYVTRTGTGPQAVVEAFPSALPPGVLPHFVTVPAGPFRMGDDRREVPLPDDYGISVYPVTNAQYAAFIKAAQRTPPTHRSGSDYPAELEHHPVVNVSWHDAKGYCDWLTTRLKAEGRLRDDEIVRLPTEMEWEKAARGTDGREYPWGNEFDRKKANTEESGIGSTTPVGKFSEGVSPYGCYDMAGNVWEWCEDWYGKDPEKPPKKGEHKRLRGGSLCFLSAVLARSAARSFFPPVRWSGLVGFRCVVVPQGSPRG
jgi:formylglycine-generating enzyme required for sulfatase activity